MTSTKTILAVAILLVAIPTTMSAQDRPPGALGPRASVLFSPARRLPGAATDSARSTGAMRGAYVGGAAVGLLGAAALAGLCDGCTPAERARSGVGGFLLGAVVGAVLGGMLGSL